MLYELFEKIYALEKQGRQIVKLNVGEPDWGAPKKVVREAGKALKGPVKYSSSAGELEFRQEIGKLHGASEKNAVVVPGSKLAIYGLVKILGAGKDVIVLSPHWTAYERICSEVGARARVVGLDMEDGWKIDFGKVEEALSSGNPGLLILNSPCNPTSKAWSEKEEEELISLARKKGAYVLADDAYRDLCFDGRKDRPLSEGLVIAHTFSKTFGMTGWRLGYAVASEEIARKMVAFNQITVTNVPTFVQKAGVLALQEKEKIAGKARRLCRRRGRIAVRELKGEVEFSKPDAGFYLFPKLPEGVETSAFVDRLLEKGVAVAPGGAFGDYQKHVRISLCAQDEVLKGALGKIREALQEMRKD